MGSSLVFLVWSYVMFVASCGVCVLCVYMNIHADIHTRTHAPMHTHTHTHTRTHTRACARTQTHSYAHKHTHTHGLFLVLSPRLCLFSQALSPYSLSLTHTHQLLRSLSQAHTHTYANTHTHHDTHSNTHTQTPHTHIHTHTYPPPIHIHMQTDKAITLARTTSRASRLSSHICISPLPSVLGAAASLSSMLGVGADAHAGASAGVVISVLRSDNNIDRGGTVFPQI